MKKKTPPSLAAKVAVKAVKTELEACQANLAEARLSLQGFAERSHALRERLTDADSEYSVLASELADYKLIVTKVQKELGKAEQNKWDALRDQHHQLTTAHNVALSQAKSTSSQYFFLGLGAAFCGWLVLTGVLGL